jgi:ATP-dependent RNA helicase DHX36
MFAPHGMSVRRFLDCAPEPPLPQAIDRSLEFLEQLGALYNQEKSLQPPSYFTEQYMKETSHPESKLTNLGRIIASLPLEPQLGRLLLYGVAMSVLHPIITLVAALAHREPCKLWIYNSQINYSHLVTLPNGDDKQAALNARDKFSKLDYSDHLMLLRVLNAYSDLNSSQLMQFCRQNFLSKPALIMIGGIRRQLFMELKRLRILPQTARDFDDPEFNHFSTSWPMIQGVIIAGSYPGIAFIRSGTKLRKIHTIVPGSQMASLHPSSSLRRQVNRSRDSMNENASSDIEPNIEVLVYQELSKIDEGLTVSDNCSNYLCSLFSYEPRRLLRLWPQCCFLDRFVFRNL